MPSKIVITVTEKEESVETKINKEELKAQEEENAH